MSEGNNNNNNNSCINNLVPPTPNNMQTLHSVSAIGDSYTEDFLKNSCEGITNGQTLFTYNAPSQKQLSLIVDEIHKMKSSINNVNSSPLLSDKNNIVNLNNNMTDEDYLKYMKVHNFKIKEEKMCMTANKLACYKLNSSDMQTCNVSIDKLNRQLYENQPNFSDPLSKNIKFVSPTEFMPTYWADSLYKD